VQSGNRPDAERKEEKGKRKEKEKNKTAAEDMSTLLLTASLPASDKTDRHVQI